MAQTLAIDRSGGDAGGDLLALSRSRTPPSRSQHLHSCTLEDRVAARISLLGRGCGALGAERGNKTSERVVSPFCPLLDPPRFGTSQKRLWGLVRWAVTRPSTDHGRVHERVRRGIGEGVAP